jgi:vancomycin aglycone glucosyltransferase
MKKICIAAIGTRGDVFPALSLVKLLNNDNKVTVICSPENKQLFQQYNIDFFAIGDDFTEVVRAGDLNYFRKQIETQFDACREIYKEADVIIGAGLFYAGRTIAEYFGKKYYHLFYTPQVLKSNLYAPPGNKRPFRNKISNKLLWLKNFVENDFIFKELINIKRKELGLTQIRSVYRYFIDQPDVVIAVDEDLAQIPSNYSAYVKQINFLYYADTKIIDERLQAFLENGSMPVLINFGSAEHAVKGFQRLLKCTIDSVHELGYRIIILSTIKNEECKYDDSILFCDYASHAVLLPKVSMIIHHGGIGTVYASLKSGTPQIIIPQILDQHFWAEIVRKKKLGEVVYPDTDAYTACLKAALIDTLNNKVIHDNIKRVSNWFNSEQYHEESLKKLHKVMPECFSEAR